MKLFKVMKDGGNLSHVWGLFFIEIKSLFSVVLLSFKDGSREAYHTHAFNSLSWVLKGKLKEYMLDGRVLVHKPSWLPVITPRDCFHKVVSEGTTTVLTFRGPWCNVWKEYTEDGEFIKLTHGRKLVK